MSSSRPLASTSTQTATSRAPRRKAAVENWDDDFEFSLPSRPNRRTQGLGPANAFTSENGDPDVNQPVKSTTPSGLPRTPKRLSPTDSFLESWDDSPPTLTSTPSRRSSRIAPLSVPSQPLGPPRLSPSPTVDLPPPKLTNRSPGFQTGTGSRKSSAVTRSRSGSINATITRNKLIKRHPSASFIPIPSTPWTASEISLPAANRSSPDVSRVAQPLTSPPSKSQALPSLPRSKSGEEMPPPPLPTGLDRSKSKSKWSKEARAHDVVRVSGIPFSPSQGLLQNEEKKPKFWKRLSGLPSERRAPSEQRRRRSSSVGGKLVPDMSAYPPPPPLPSNLRSPSQASTASASSSTRSGAGNALSSLLRRSTSSLSRWSDKSQNTPPSAFSRQVSARPMRTSAIPLSPEQQYPMESPSLSRSFSRGFHLPSPSPGSPYHHPAGLGFPNSLDAPPLPHSISFPTIAPVRRENASGSESEAGDQQTPKRRKKVRPVSAMPATRVSDPPTVTWQNAPLPNVPLSPTGFAASTMKRLGSLSKKHGRRLSGGFNFGTHSSSSSNECKREKLETVAGSPSKPTRAAFGAEDDTNSGREMSVSAPNSLFKPPPTPQVEGSAIGSTSEEIGTKKTDSQRRRQSWNDFVIPRDVQAKQKGVRQSIEAFKQFATRVEALKALLQTHADLMAQIQYGRNESAKVAFAALETEFAQWWEMAMLFIALSTTTQAASATHTLPSASPRMRRITLASDEAHAASELLRTASGSSQLSSMNVSLALPNSHVDHIKVPRKISLPDPENTDLLAGPPRATPEHWRGSTGRQDLSKRQLDMLKDMIHAPLNGRPAPTRRQTSTLSASSAASSVLPFSQSDQGENSGSKTMRILSRSTPTSTERTHTVTMPGSGDSAYIVPSGSFPSPNAASDLARPPAKRWPSRAGLAGLKDFLRSLKNPAPKSPTAKVHGRKDRPSPLSLQPQTGPKSVPSGSSTPISPTRPLTASFEQLRFPVNPANASASSFSALGGRGASNRGRSPSPRKANGHVARPSIRHMFRSGSGSGSWSELVRGGGGGGSSGPSTPTLPKHDVPGRAAADAPAVVDGLPQGGGRGVAKQASRRSLGLARRSSSRNKHETHAHPPHVANPPSMAGSKLSDTDGTLRPHRKSRIMGLGYPDLPVGAAVTPSGLGGRTPTSPVPYSSAGQAYDSPERSASAPAWVFPRTQDQRHEHRQQQHQQQQHPQHQQQHQHHLQQHHQQQQRHQSLQSHADTRDIMRGDEIDADGHTDEYANTGADADADAEEGDQDALDLEMVALTPENLPGLIGYLRQCEGKLGEWRKRVEQVEVGFGSLRP